MKLILPTALQLERALALLMRRDVEAETQPVATRCRFAAAGSYFGGDGPTLAWVGADLPLAAYLGAALSLVPADAARECVKAGDLDGTLRENFAEVLNVSACLVTRNDGGRLALQQPAFGDVAAAALLPPATARMYRALFRVEIAGYGAGLMGLWGVA
ncbi:hypothetical protein [Pseudacidovorax intermedius]|uniref:hypothetical protein n=1 Tax=Pseudacidovorax intermedius TaxID=433924 RepID=UPI001B2D337D|nr:hypothetical protein [Pseudacidovorax intermedius]MBO9643933.1 hypothetical protein [Pseudacidovorax sp.]